MSNAIGMMIVRVKGSEIAALYTARAVDTMRSIGKCEAQELELAAKLTALHEAEGRRIERAMPPDFSAVRPHGVHHHHHGHGRTIYADMDPLEALENTRAFLERLKWRHAYLTFMAEHCEPERVYELGAAALRILHGDTGFDGPAFFAGA